MALARTIKQLRKTIEAPVDDFGLYSKAEDAALKLVNSSAQDIHLGSDLRNYLKGRGVSEKEIKELKLDKLLSRRRVTKAELLDFIRQNKVKFSEEEITRRRPHNFVRRQLPFDEAYSPDFVDEMVKEYTGDPLFVLDLNESDDELRRFARGEIDFDSLGISAQDEFKQRVGKILEEQYYEEPVFEHKLLIDGNETDYNILESRDGSFYLRADAPPFLRRNWNFFTQDNRGNTRDVSEASEARDFLELQAETTGELGSNVDLYEELTSPGGTNYRVFQFKLEGDEVYRGGHFNRQNPVFHARLKDRIDPDTGNNILYVEELQNDMSNIARKRQGPGGKPQGFQDAQKIAELEDDINDYLADAMNLISDFDDDIKNIPVSAVDTQNPLDEDNLYGLQYLSRALDDYKAERYRGASVKLHHAIENFNDFLVRATDEIRFEERFNQLNQREIDALYRANHQSAGLLPPREPPPPERVRQSAYNYFMALARAGRIAEENLPPAGPAMKAAREQLREQLNRAGVKDFPVEDLGDIEYAAKSSREAARALNDEQIKTPSMQFVTNPESWTRLAIKRLIKKADEEGYDGIAFSPGEIHRSRYPVAQAENLPKFYDEFLPIQIKKVTGVKPNKFIRVSSEVDDYDYKAPMILLSDKTPTGETVSQKATKGMTTYALPLAAAGLAGLAAPDMAQAGEVPIEEGIGQLPRRTSGERGLLEEVGDFVRYGPGVGVDALNAMILRPVAGSLAGRTAFTLGMDPETIRDAQSRVESLVDYEASPGEEAYGQRILSGIADLLESDTAQTAAPYVMPALEALEDASQRVTSGILGLNERLYGDEDDPERTDALLETIRPGIEAIQPI